MSRPESTALFGGKVLIVQPHVVHALEGSVPAAILVQQLEYLCLERGRPEIAYTQAQWVSHLDGIYNASTISRAWQILERLGGVEAGAGKKRPPRRILHEQLAERVRMIGANCMQDAPIETGPDPAPGPRQPPIVTVLEGEREADGEGEPEVLHPESLTADAAAPASSSPVVDGQGGRTGKAPRGSVEEALRVLGSCGHSSTRCQVLARDLCREPAPVDGAEWAAAYAPDFPRWAVIRALLHVRQASAEERDRVEARLVAISWRDLNRERRERSA